jgi:hypothetical protein
MPQNQQTAAKRASLETGLVDRNLEASSTSTHNCTDLADKKSTLHPLVVVLDHLEIAGVMELPMCHNEQRMGM